MAATPRLFLFAHAMFVRLRIVARNVVALVGAVVALAPLLVRRRPLGHRTHLSRSAARVIPLEERRRATRV